MLDANHLAFESNCDVGTSSPSNSKPGSFWQFLVLGIEHILTGYDHLCFLLGLLIAGGGIREVLKIITAFTVAHSITLALATLNFINIPPKIIEPLIAVSIIYVGIENILRRDLRRRWLLSFGFGLIHGCGFASALRDLNIGANGSGIAVPLLSFNLGVEVGQVAIASLLLPCIWKLKHQPAFAMRYAPACSMMVSLAGGYWLLQRVWWN
jgi:hydrogenase/urease accessory protein HupE